MKKAFTLALIAIFALSGIANAAQRQATMKMNPEQPHFGDTVLFTVTTENVEASNVWVECYQNGSFVLWGGGLIYRYSPYTEKVTLRSPSYSSGSATCTVTVNAYAGNKRIQKPLVKETFTVLP